MSAEWNFVIVVATLGGLLGLLWLLLVTSAAPAPDEEESTGHTWDGDLTELNNPLPRWWVNLFYITLVLGAIYLVLYPGLGDNDMLLGWTQERQYEAELAAAEARYAPVYAAFAERSVATLADDPAARKVGARLFATYCTGCHGSDAGGGRGFPSLRDEDWQWGGAAAAIETSIAAGRTAVMPAWGAVAGEQGTRELTEYVLELAGRDVDRGLADAGKARFSQLCVACHGGAGEGKPEAGAPRLADDIWLYGGDREAVAASIAGGRNGKMPAHGGFLGPIKVRLLAAYVHGLSRQ